MIQPPTGIRTDIGAGDTRISNICALYCLFVSTAFLGFLSTRILITTISYYRGGRCKLTVHAYTCCVCVCVFPLVLMWLYQVLYRVLLWFYIGVHTFVVRFPRVNGPGHRKVTALDRVLHGFAMFLHGFASLFSSLDTG